MTTLANRIEGQMRTATLEDLFELDNRVEQTQILLTHLKSERDSMFREIQRQRIEKEDLAFIAEEKRKRRDQRNRAIRESGLCVSAPPRNLSSQLAIEPTPDEGCDGDRWDAQA
jgi:hypothetical protein